MSSIQAIAATIISLAAPGKKPKELIDAVREQHPGASKKDIVRAAFYALIEHKDGASDQAQHLQAFALGERGLDEGDAVVQKRPSKKGKRKAQKDDHRTAH
ncbi:hypothetical protein [Methylobacterium soli]|uniref:Uncharacterized protein n=1 Tax=Methylobacterium soli TaxID=553447 RepID=A0A6L3SQT8_9HYPH|nr:hypothetical protein [Methylobacterium soli]KAB1072232.1 hypothetical protein F6X53_28415 [Methylobacterium soli]GJE45688.1 hypothetical protein AEGHOMDF_4888 [Methylobacterium soli]